VKVVLTGEGSDETLAGYARYRTTIYNLALGRSWERMGGAHLRGVTRRAIDTLPASARLRRRLSRTFLYLPVDLATLYFDNFAVFSRARQRGLLSRDSRDKLSTIDPYATMQGYMHSGNGVSLLNQLLYADTKTYLHELLMKQDQMSMAASIESRVPFLDHPLMEFAAQLPDSMKLRGLTTKYVLRKAMTGFLPDQVLSRSKMGFPVPIGRWFRGPFRHLVDEYVLGERASTRGLIDPTYVRDIVAQHERGEGGHDERLWSLVNLEIWQRIFLDAESVTDTTAAMSRLLERASPAASVAGAAPRTPLPLAGSKT
jgi:asparagine synthase (glutamine-hydrolysing)